MNNTYKVAGRVNCIVSPLGDKESVIVTSNINSVIKQPQNKIGRALIDVYVYDEDLKHLNHGWKLDIEDTKNDIKKLEDWINQILIKVECRIMKYITRENWDNMIQNLIDLRFDIRQKILNSEIKSR